MQCGGIVAAVPMEEEEEEGHHFASGEEQARGGGDFYGTLLFLYRVFLPLGRENHPSVASPHKMK